jgi:hypothetical protein
MVRACKRLSNLLKVFAIQVLEPRLRRVSATVYGSPQEQKSLYQLKTADRSPRGRVATLKLALAWSCLPASRVVLQPCYALATHLSATSTIQI